MTLRMIISSNNSPKELKTTFVREQISTIRTKMIRTNQQNFVNFNTSKSSRSKFRRNSVKKKMRNDRSKWKTWSLRGEWNKSKMNWKGERNRNLSKRAKRSLIKKREKEMSGEISLNLARIILPMLNIRDSKLLSFNSSHSKVRNLKVYNRIIRTIRIQIFKTMKPLNDLISMHLTIEILIAIIKITHLLILITQQVRLVNSNSLKCLSNIL